MSSAHRAGRLLGEAPELWAERGGPSRRAACEPPPPYSVGGGPEIRQVARPPRSLANCPRQTPGRAKGYEPLLIGYRETGGFAFGHDRSVPMLGRGYHRPGSRVVGSADHVVLVRGPDWLLRSSAGRAAEYPVAVGRSARHPVTRLGATRAPSAGGTRRVRLLTRGGQYAPSDRPRSPSATDSSGKDEREGRAARTWGWRNRNRAPAERGRCGRRRYCAHRGQTPREGTLQHPPPVLTFPPP